MTRKHPLDPSSESRRGDFLGTAIAQAHSDSHAHMNHSVRDFVSLCHLAPDLADTVGAELRRATRNRFFV